MKKETVVVVAEAEERDTKTMYDEEQEFCFVF
jgi:hypothetical protein